MMSSMKINCLNPASLNAVMLNLNQRKEKELDRPCVNMLHTVMAKCWSVLGNDLCKSINLDSFLE